MLGDSKTGRSMRPLSTAAVELLRSAITRMASFSRLRAVMA
jgi:hypothetical protein